MFYLQRTGGHMHDIYARPPPRGPMLDPRGPPDDDDFSDDETNNLTEPIYNGR